LLPNLGHFDTYWQALHEADRLNETLKLSRKEAIQIVLSTMRHAPPAPAQLDMSL
jgi:hypothetical protein